MGRLLELCFLFQKIHLTGFHQYLLFKYPSLSFVFFDLIDCLLLSRASSKLPKREMVAVASDNIYKQMT